MAMLNNQMVSKKMLIQWDLTNTKCLVGGLEDVLLFHHIWNVIPTPLTKSIIFQDGHIAPPSRLLMIILVHIITIGILTQC